MFAVDYALLLFGLKLSTRSVAIRLINQLFRATYLIVNGYVLAVKVYLLSDADSILVEFTVNVTYYLLCMVNYVVMWFNMNSMRFHYGQLLEKVNSHQSQRLMTVSKALFGLFVVTNLLTAVSMIPYVIDVSAIDRAQGIIITVSGATPIPRYQNVLITTFRLVYQPCINNLIPTINAVYMFVVYLIDAVNRSTLIRLYSQIEASKLSTDHVINHILQLKQLHNMQRSLLILVDYIPLLSLFYALASTAGYIQPYVMGESTLSNILIDNPDMLCKILINRLDTLIFDYSVFRRLYLADCADVRGQSTEQ